MDWFVCKAAASELTEPPSHEKISFRHAFLSSLQDKTAFILTSCFESSLKEVHSALFPSAQIDFIAPPRLYSNLVDPPPFLTDSQQPVSPPPEPESPTSSAHPLASRRNPHSTLLLDQPDTTPSPPLRTLRRSSRQRHPPRREEHTSDTPPSILSPTTARGPRATAVDSPPPTTSTSTRPAFPASASVLFRIRAGVGRGTSVGGRGKG